MCKSVAATFFCSGLSLIGASGFAVADTIGRFECNYVGPVSQEPIGDRDGHNVVSVQYSCFGVDGLLKEAVYTGTSVSEWNGPKGMYLLSGGTVRSPGAFAVTQLLEGIGSVVMKDGQPVGAEAKGRAIFKFASGTLATLAGRTFNFVSKPIGYGRFDVELSD
jgi:hypothetical protein